MNMDEAIKAAFPLIPAPRGGEIEPASVSGTRFVVAADGVWREITLPWARLRHRIAEAEMAMPYGVLQPLVQVRCNRIPEGIIREFIADARANCPNEVAGVFLWHGKTGDWRYQRRQAYSASGAHVHYMEVQPLEDEHLVVDVHSHGMHPAFFSPEDDADDAGAMKFSLVLGNLDQVQPTSKMRLCMAGVVLNGVRLGDDGALEVA